MQDQEHSKRSIDQVEDARSEKHALNEKTVPVPVLLDGFSEDELKKIGRRATWKLDLIIMPAMTMFVFAQSLETGTIADRYRNYILNYLDRQNIAAARLAGIMEDLNLSITEYNTVVSVLFAGYSRSLTQRWSNEGPILIQAFQFSCKCLRTSSFPRFAIPRSTSVPPWFFGVQFLLAPQQ